MTRLPDPIERMLADYVERGGTLDQVLDDEEELLLGAILTELRTMNGRDDPALFGNPMADLDGATFNRQNWHVNDSDVLDDVDEGGTVTLSPGDDEPIVEARPEGQEGAVLAVGAKDRSDVVYYLKVDSEEHHRPTNSPLGTVNSPYSFIEHGGTVPFGNRVEYRARYLDGGSGDVEVGARLIWYEPEP
jgi:hypothetical protein